MGGCTQATGQNTRDQIEVIEGHTIEFYSLHSVHAKNS